jgi:transposase InsO family protein
MRDLCRLIGWMVVDLIRSRVMLEAEISTLRQQINVLRRTAPKKLSLFVRRLRSMGIRDRPTSPRSPWQNGFAERLIGSIRRECLDHVVVFGERHLRHILLSYMKYYNEVRTHLSLEKDTPVSRAVERTGHILCRPVLGGLHHQYIRI